MRFLFYSICILMCVGMFFLMMKVKADVSVMVRQRAQLSYQQAQLQEDIRVLKAEYAMLSAPERLTELALARGFVEAKMGQLN